MPKKCLADTLVTDYGGRAVCFVTGQPSGLTKTLPDALTQLRKVTGNAKIMLGFDRGGAYASVFTHCRDADVNWITYRRGGLAAVTAEPARYWLARAECPGECVTLVEETVTVNEYGQCRQLTLFENGDAKLQILTSDTTAPAAPTADLNGVACEVVAPSLVPKGGSDRVKTDKRDAIRLARPHRAGELTAIHIPTPDQEAVRDLVRVRGDLLADRKRAQVRITAMLMRHGRIWRAGAKWRDKGLRTTFR